MLSGCFDGVADSFLRMDWGFAFSTGLSLTVVLLCMDPFSSDF